MTDRPVVHSTFKIEREYPSPPARVSSAFADPATKRRWFAEDEGWEFDEFTLDFRVGGREATRFRFKGDPARPVRLPPARSSATTPCTRTSCPTGASCSPTRWRWRPAHLRVARHRGDRPRGRRHAPHLHRAGGVLRGRGRARAAREGVARPGRSPASVLEGWEGGAYLSWDNREDRREIRAARWPGGASLVVLDELHKWRTWKGWIKGEFDQHRPRLRFLVAGSARMDMTAVAGTRCRAGTTTTVCTP